jgi:hypothetical protein
MSTQRIQFQKKRVYHRGVVACRKCGGAIHVYKLNALGDEFAVRCARCGERGFYSKREMAIEDLPERRKKPRR